MRAQGEAHVVADEPDRERAPAVARARGGVQRQHVERDGVARRKRPAEDRVRVAIGLDVGDLLERAVLEHERALVEEAARGQYQVWLARDPATNSSVLSRGTGSSGIQNETVSEPSTL